MYRRTSTYATQTAVEWLRIRRELTLALYAGCAGACSRLNALPISSAPSGRRVPAHALMLLSLLPQLWSPLRIADTPSNSLGEAGIEHKL